MQTTLTTIGGLRRSVEITLSYDELAPHFERAYSEVQRDLQLEGFRKGKVPMDIIKSRYGDKSNAMHSATLPAMHSAQLPESMSSM